MSTIESVYSLLDWNNHKSEQVRGIALAQEIKELDVFFQPVYEKYNKNIWDNCAYIISQKTDDMLRPYLYNILQWIMDMNWRGAFCIFERLVNFVDKIHLASVIDSCINEAAFSNDEIWHSNLTNLKEHLL